MPNEKFLLCLLLLALLVSMTRLPAQEQIGFRQLSIKDGLSQNSAISIAQDSTGYLWIATQDGLNKYDGRSFTKYPYIFADVTRPNYSHLGKVYVDRKGTVWCIPYDKKLHRLNAKANRFEPLEVTSDATIIYQDRDLNYWVGTYRTGIVLLDSLGRKLPLPSPIAAGSTCYDILQEGTNMLLATDRGVLRVGLASKKALDTLRHTATGQLVTRGFSTLQSDQTGRQWLGTYGGGLYFKNPGEDFLHPANDLPLSQPLDPQLNILSLFVDTHQNLWVGTYGSGLFKVDLNAYTVQHFRTDKHNPKAIHYNDILSIYEDYTGTLWFGTDGAGASYYDAFLEKFNSITNFQVPDDIHVDVVRAIATDCRESVWIGTSGKGLMQLNQKTGQWHKYDTRETGLLSDRIMSLLCGVEGNLLIGTQGGGLSLLSPDGTIVNYLNTPRYNTRAVTIWDIFQDSRGITWLATRENGLLQFDTKTGVVKAFNTSSGFPDISDNIRVITEGAKGELWLGTDSEGLVRLHPENGQAETYYHDPLNASIASDKIKSLYYDPSGVLWVGTYGKGLSALDTRDQSFHTFDETNGLANNVVYAILPDEHNNLWLSSNRGISRFSPPPDWRTAPSIVNYTNYEGLATEFNTGAYYKAQDGTLYFGGLEGFYWFVPETIQTHTQLPKTVITGLMVANEPRVPHDGLELDHRENTLSFTFASLQYSLPEKNQYQYRLLNYDKQWIPAEHTNFARYSFLPPGRYEFQVKSSNYDGVWNEAPARFAFVIRPPWYASWWARALYALLLLLGVASAYYYLKWRWRMKLDLQLKQEEASRWERLNDFKTKLYTDISHEFRTPLSLIAAPVENKLTKGGLSDAEFAELSMIKRNTHRLIGLVDQLLQLARLEKGKWPIRLRQDDAGLFIRALLPTFEYQAALKKIQYTWTVAEIKDVWFDSDVLEKILVNLLANALKYCPEGGTCSLSASQSGNRICLEIHNTVEDPATIELDQLFDRFYQGADYDPGAGIGLSLVRELVALYHGEIGAHLDGNTICFSLELPTDPEAIPGAQKIGEGPHAIHLQGRDPVAEKREADNGKKDGELPLVLLVEDHEEVRDYLKKAWADKYQILEASNGAEGIQLALENVPELILTDIRMPQCSGIELCNILKQDECTSHIPIILLTSGGEVETELKGLESGADDFVTKPFKLPVLEKRIDNLINTRRSLRHHYSQEYILEAKNIAITPTDEQFLNKVQAIMEQHLSDPQFNATAFCRLVGMSRMQLHRKLQLYTGLSTTAFIRSQRLKQAEQLIRASDLSINEVAYAVGFNTPSYFIKCFREAYDTTPAAYVDRQ